MLHLGYARLTERPSSARRAHLYPEERRGVRGVIEVQVEHAAALFDPFDPFPLPFRDLATPVEEFIVDAARGAGDGPIRLFVRIIASGAREGDAAELEGVFAAHFTRRAERLTRDMRELFRTGRLALVIGLFVLAVCTFGADAITNASRSALAGFASEGLIILGWVANWRPIEIFLYEWWPLARTRALYRRIAAAPLKIRWG